MSFYEKLTTFLRDDPMIRSVLRNSGYLFSGNAVSAMLGLVQGVLIVRLLGIEQFGLS